MSKLKIALDAGHGLNTAGRRCLAQFDPKQHREWWLNDRIADRLEEKLTAYDCEVLRVDDTTGAQDVSLAARVAAANAWGADVYLSIHHNAGINGGAGGGTVVYHYCNLERNVDLASLLYQRIVAATGLVGNRSGKVVKRALYVLANTKMRAYLVENGFMDSATDVPVIISEEHADKTVQGILRWLAEDLALASSGADSGANSEPDEPLDVDTDPADLAVGVEVAVNGTIYATGKGTGNGITKNGDHMYIIGYAGDNYPYCWGVAKEPGGTRQGWARAEDLTVVAGADESLVDGSSVAYFPAVSYAGSSLIDGLKAAGADSSYAYRKQVAAANEIAGYTGTAAQNSRLLQLLKAGKLIKP